jgi:HlyD family secretion protein
VFNKEWLLRWSPRSLIGRGAIGLATAAVLVFLLVRSTGSGLAASPDLETAPVVRTEFVDLLTLRGEVKAVRSVLVTAPSAAGELQVVKLARNGSEVKKGEVVAEFDKTTVERQLAEKRSALRQAEAEISRARAQARLQEEGALTDQTKARYEVERAKLDVGTRDVISRLDAEKYVIKLGEAEQKLREVDAKLVANRAGGRAEIQGLEQKRNKALMDVQIEERKLKALTLYAPIDGIMTLNQNWRVGGPFGQREWRTGDRSWPGAVLGELPELASPYIAAKIDETDRGRLRAGMDAIVVVEALPGVELSARIREFSTLAKPDFTSWPPPRLFDAVVDLDKQDARLRPGMTASIRVAVERLPRAIVIPSRALMQPGGSPFVYVVGKRGLERRAVVVSRRNQEQVAIKSGLQEGERVALEDPEKKS